MFLLLSFWNILFYIIFILGIINDWDPIGLTNITPKGEYLSEATKIEIFLNSNKNVSVEELSEYIKDVFIKNFDCKIFSFEIEDIKIIAEKILGKQS